MRGSEMSLEKLLQKYAEIEYLITITYGHEVCSVLILDQHGDSVIEEIGLPTGDLKSFLTDNLPD
jgi:hypothetical protein